MSCPAIIVAVMPKVSSNTPEDTVNQYVQQDTF